MVLIARVVREVPTVPYGCRRDQVEDAALSPASHVAAAGAVGAAGAVDADVLEDLADEIATLSAHIHAATHRLLVRGWRTRTTRPSCSSWRAAPRLLSWSGWFERGRRETAAMRPRGHGSNTSHARSRWLRTTTGCTSCAAGSRRKSVPSSCARSTQPAMRSSASAGFQMALQRSITRPPAAFTAM